ncbi:hypothetical protein ARSEF4850_002488 [Beauveria asiatica]
MHLPGALALSLGLAASAVSARQQQQQQQQQQQRAVLLSSVQSLTLRGGGAKTSHRRVPAAPQLRCVSPRALCDLHAIDVMRCTNQGSSYGDEDVEWSCAAELPAELKLGATDVVCEGYASSDDPHVLKGSCGVEYTLALTDLGERRYPDLARGRDRWFGAGGDAHGADNAWAAGLFFLVFVAVVAWIAYSACVAASDNNRRQANTARRYGGGGDGGGGGGGGGGWGPGGGGWGPRNDPPPPYPGTNNSYKSSSNGGSSSSSSSSQQQQGWRPGFWTGLASGAAASYLASGRNRDNRNNYGYAPWGSNNYGSGSRWGGGDSWAGPSSSSSSSSRRGGSSSGERHESTGFGSTRRR